MRIHERAPPVPADVAGACAMLGLDPLTVGASSVEVADAHMDVTIGKPGQP